MHLWVTWRVCMHRLGIVICSLGWYIIQHYLKAILKMVLPEPNHFHKSFELLNVLQREKGSWNYDLRRLCKTNSMAGTWMKKCCGYGEWQVCFSEICFHCGSQTDREANTVNEETRAHFVCPCISWTHQTGRAPNNQTLYISKIQIKQWSSRGWLRNQRPFHFVHLKYLVQQKLTTWEWEKLMAGALFKQNKNLTVWQNLR